MAIIESYGITVTVNDTDGSTVLEGVDVFASNLSTGRQLTGNSIGLTGTNGVAEIDAANIGPYNNGDTIEITAYQVGKRAKTTHVIVSQAGSGTATLTMEVATSYTTATKVAQLLQRDAFVVNPDNGDLSSIAVEDMIKRFEDYIDNETGHAWRIRRSGTDSGDNTTAIFEGYNLDNPYKRQAGIPIYLKNRTLRDLDSGEGDALEVWEGSGSGTGKSETWTDWLADKTQQRNQDYWLNYETGILFIRNQLIKTTPFKVRIKYRYGETVVAKDVEDACTKFVAIDIMLNGLGLNARSNTVNYTELARMWKEQADRVVDRRREFKPLVAKLPG